MANFKIPYGRQYISPEDEAAVVSVLHSDFLTQGPNIADFEANFAQYVGAKYAVAVANGTAALHLPFLAIDLKPGDRIITTPITFVASANCARYCGAEVYFADIDPDTFVISIEKVRALLESHPKGFFKAIVPVDFTGFPVNMEQIRELAAEYGLFVLEDACHAPGAWFTDSKGINQRSGNGFYADATVFSFHPVKHIAAGEGGMITTNNEDLYKKMMVLRTHGINRENLVLDIPHSEEQGSWYYEMQLLGFNYRLTDIQAALANSQLKRADAGIAARQSIAETYRKAFSVSSKIGLQADKPGFFNAYHLFVIQVDNRKGLYDFLRANGIYSQIHYIPVHLMPYYRQFGWKPGDFPHAENYYNRCISLPMFPTLTAEEQNFVIEKVLEFVG